MKTRIKNIYNYLMTLLAISESFAVSMHMHDGLLILSSSIHFVFKTDSYKMASFHLKFLVK